MVDLTLTNVVFESNNPIFYIFKSTDLTLTNVVFESLRYRRVCRKLLI